MTFFLSNSWIYAAKKVLFAMILLWFTKTTTNKFFWIWISSQITSSFEGWFLANKRLYYVYLNIVQRDKRNIYVTNCSFFRLNKCSFSEPAKFPLIITIYFQLGKNLFVVVDRYFYYFFIVKWWNDLKLWIIFFVLCNNIKTMRKLY